ncbi:coiled-coil domain-containing protein [Fusibacter tunisiensis]|uniref:Peptidoglycan hydrolase CwlO-like protein n=1 Tax=Fusibacter tunisiensis TaxID=1008308 RepID=A0ABS2MRD9_9FIRM|nr:hypothetical protein [Fusibacter tunisiensis]MBM7561983.1 peptidoglycan hydrolase CwlO-like protein [Fusibacter tunisiensis]
MKTVQLLILCGFILVLNFGVSSAELQASPLEIEDKLEMMKKTEQETIETLFELYSKMELAQTEKKKIERDIQELTQTLNGIQLDVDEKTRQLDVTKDALRQSLISRQKTGTGSLIQMILESERIKDFIDRLYLIRDLSRHTNELLLAVEDQAKRLTLEQEKLQALRSSLEDKESDLTRQIEKITTSVLELESFLEGLTAEKAVYEMYLQSIESLWNSLTPMFTDMVTTINALIEQGDFPEDMIEVNFSLFSAKGVLRDAKFNSVLMEKEALPQMSFKFSDEGAVVELPEYKLVLQGEFLIETPQIMKFEVTGGTFNALPMSEAALTDLFSEGDLIFNLEKLLGKNEIKRIEHKEGYMVLDVGIKLF